MFDLFVILFACAVVIFGMLGWIYFDQKENKGKMQRHFRENYHKLN